MALLIRRIDDMRPRAPVFPYRNRRKKVARAKGAHLYRMPLYIPHRDIGVTGNRDGGIGLKAAPVKQQRAIYLQRPDRLRRQLRLQCDRRLAIHEKKGKNASCHDKQKSRDYQKQAHGKAHLPAFSTARTWSRDCRSIRVIGNSFLVAFYYRWRQ